MPSACGNPLITCSSAVRVASWNTRLSPTTGSKIGLPDFDIASGASRGAASAF
jgi:hypothetical protein